RSLPESNLQAWPILTEFRYSTKVILYFSLKKLQKVDMAILAISATSGKEMSLLKFLRIYSLTLLNRSHLIGSRKSLTCPGLARSVYSWVWEKISNMDRREDKRWIPFILIIPFISAFICSFVFPQNAIPRVDNCKNFLSGSISGILRKSSPRKSSLKWITIASASSLA